MKTVKIAILKSIAKNLLIFSPLIFIMMLTNYFVDPNGLFRARRGGEDIAKIFMRGLNVANMNHEDDRLLQVYYIKASKEPKDVIALGSSRIMQLDGSKLGGKKFFNHGVSGATLEDFFSICEIYEQQDKLPGMIILGLDPWILNKNNGQEDWKYISMYNYAFRNKLWGARGVNAFLARYDYLMFKLKRKLRLISPFYFNQAIRCLAGRISELMKTGRMRIGHYATQSDNFDVHSRLDVNIRIADGTISYGKDYILKNRANLKTYISQDRVFSLEGFYKLDKANQLDFEKFIEYLLKKNAKVVFFLTPYHPYVHTYLMSSAQYWIIAEIAKVEAYFRSLGAQKHIMVIGSYDPLRYGLEDQDFYDGMHPTRKGIAKLSGFLTPVKTDGYIGIKE